MDATAQIFVANLSPGVTEDNLRSVFGMHGTVAEVNLLTDQVSGQSRGVAFVTMNSGAEAQAAMNALNATELGGRPLVLNAAKPRRGSPKPDRRRRFRGRKPQRRRPT
jgi:RNA recognition motif-containing protein